MIIASTAPAAAIVIGSLIVMTWPEGDCVVGAQRSLRSSASSFACVSGRTALLLDRARLEETWDPASPVLDVAGIRSIDGAPNRDVLPDFYLAPRFAVAAEGTIERDRVLVDHLPPKMAGLGAPSRGAASGGVVVLEQQRSGLARLRIRSPEWSVLASTVPAWSEPLPVAAWCSSS